MLSWILENSLVVLLLAGVVVLASRRLRRSPALCHFLWLLLLVRLVAPVVPGVRLPSVEVARLVDRAEAHIDALVPATERPDAPPAACRVPAQTDVERDERARPAVASSDESRSHAQPEPAAAPDEERGARDAAAIRLLHGEGDDPAVSLLLSGGLEGARSTPTDSGRGLRVVLAVYLLGCVHVLVRQAKRICSFDRLVRSGRSAPPELRALVAQVARRLGVRAPEVRVVPGVGSPVVWACGRARLVWPGDADGAPLPAPSRAIVAHELAHLRRRDHWVAWLELAVQVLHWWNPLHRFVRRRLREEAELACDAWALWAYPGDRREYAAALVGAAERLAILPRTAPALGATDSSARGFERRLRTILAGGGARRLSPLTALALVAFALPLLPNRPAAAQAGDGDGAAFELVEIADVAAPLDPELERAARAAVERRRADELFRAGDWPRAAQAYATLCERGSTDGEAWGRLGRALLSQQDPELGARAAAAFARQAELSEDVALAQYHGACAHAVAGERERALELLGAAVDAGFDEATLVEKDRDLQVLRGDPRYADLVRRARAASEARRAAGAAMEGRDWTTASRRWMELTQLAPRSGLAQERLGFVLVLRDELEYAIRSFERQIELGFATPRGHYNLACALALDEQTGPALDHLERALSSGFRELRSVHRDPHLGSLRELPRFEEIVAPYSEVAELAAAMAQQLEAKDYAAAEGSLRRYLELRPDDLQARRRLGEVLSRLGRHEEALTCFEQQARNAHEVDDALFDLGCCHSALGEPETALACLARAVDAGFLDQALLRSDERLAPLHDDERYLRIAHEASSRAFLESQGAADFEQLRDRCLARIAHDGTNARDHYQLGWAWLRLGRFEEAEAAFARQLELGFAPAAAHYNIACAAAGRGAAERAFEHIEAAIALGFDDADLLAADLDLLPLHGDPRLDALVARLRGETKVAAAD